MAVVWEFEMLFLSGISAAVISILLVSMIVGILGSLFTQLLNLQNV